MENSFRSFVNVEKKQPPAVPLQLLPDECVSSRCEECKFHFQFSETHFGSVICTNFRLCLVSDIPIKFPMSRLRMINENVHIPLCSILYIKYAVFKGGKARLPLKKVTEKELKQFKLLETTLSSLDIISCLKIYLKDMRVLYIDLTKSQHASGLANYILHFSRLPAANHLVQIDCSNHKIMYNDKESWQRELTRCVRDRLMSWRVVDLRVDSIHSAVPSYPMHVVVCSGFGRDFLREAASIWRRGRFPIWTYATARGVSLFRSSIPSDPNHPVVIKLYDTIAGAHDSNDAPFTMDVDPELSCDRVASAFEKLHKLCAVDNKARADRYEKNWLKRVTLTGWITLLHQALGFASQAILRLDDPARKQSVVVADKEGRDGSAVVSSLIQICLDKEYRRFDGFERLIAKEWSALGYPFGRRQLGIGGGRCCPFWLLFLDCVHQLIVLYPTQFEFSSLFLVSLWDLSLTGVPPSLTCDDVSEQLAMGKSSRLFPLSQYFSDQYSAFFPSIEFRAALTMKALNFTTPWSGEIIWPPTEMVNIELWNECYLRWQPSALISEGGAPLEGWALDQVMQDVVQRRKSNTDVQWTPVYPATTQGLSSLYPFSSDAFVDGEDDRTSIGSMSSLQISETGDTPISSRTKRFFRTTYV